MLTAIMAGGVGTRFWPRSRKNRPKQLLDLTGKGSMIRITVDRLAGLSKPEEILVITNVEQRDAILDEISSIIPPENVIGEPVGRNTAPCIGLGAVLLRRKHGEQPMLVLPADHIVEATATFHKLVESAAAYVAEHGSLLTFGVKPTRPETGYGYIHAVEPVCGDRGARIYRVAAFLEKPTADKARTFVEDGDYYWNSGMFMWTTESILKEIEIHIPELSNLLAQIESELGTRDLPEVLNSLYPKAPSVSIDYGVMERAKDVVMIKAEFGWNDVGSWEFVRDVYPSDEAGNVLVGEHVLVDASNNTVFSPDRTIGLVGVNDVVVVDGGDTVLVCDRNRVQDVKKIVEALKDRSRDDLV